MYKVMKALVEVDSTVSPSRSIPGLGNVSAGERGQGARADAKEFRASAGQAYLIAYMRALLSAATTEAKKT